MGVKGVYAAPLLEMLKKINYIHAFRYPGLITCESEPGGGTTDYAVSVHHSCQSTNTHSLASKLDILLESEQKNF